MNDEDKMFPLPAGAGLREQAEAMARAAWLMAAPGAMEPPASPKEEDRDEPKMPSDSIRCSPRVR
jgi:hypothetical protein